MRKCSCGSHVHSASAVYRRQKMKEKTYECAVETQSKQMETASVVISAAAVYRRQMKVKTYEFEAKSHS